MFRRKTDKPQGQPTKTADQLVAECMREYLQNPQRRATDLLSKVRAAAEDRRRDAARSPQLDMFAA